MESLQRFPVHESPSSPARRTRSQFLTHLFFILFCLEIGLVLLLLPWTHLWDNNYLFSVTTEWNRAVVQLLSPGSDFWPGDSQHVDRG